MVQKTDTGASFLQYFGFSCQSSLHQALKMHYLSSGASTTDHTLVDVPNGLTPRNKKNKIESYCDKVVLNFHIYRIWQGNLMFLIGCNSDDGHVEREGSQSFSSRKYNISLDFRMPCFCHIDGFISGDSVTLTH
jgi:hypothetical protein